MRPEGQRACGFGHVTDLQSPGFSHPGSGASHSRRAGWWRRVKGVGGKRSRWVLAIERGDRCYRLAAGRRGAASSGAPDVGLPVSRVQMAVLRSTCSPTSGGTRGTRLCLAQTLRPVWSRFSPLSLWEGAP